MGFRSRFAVLPRSLPEGFLRLFVGRLSGAEVARDIVQHQARMVAQIYPDRSNCWVR
jgi:hypothetical protein